MIEFLEFILENILGNKEFSIKEEYISDNKTRYVVTVKDDQKSLLIGKGGKTINAVRSLLKIKARLQNKMVDVSIAEDEPIQPEINDLNTETEIDNTEAE